MMTEMIKVASDLRMARKRLILFISENEDLVPEQLEEIMGMSTELRSMAKICEAWEAPADAPVAPPAARKPRGPNKKKEESVISTPEEQESLDKILDESL